MLRITREESWSNLKANWVLSLGELTLSLVLGELREGSKRDFSNIPNLAYTIDGKISSSNERRSSRLMQMIRVHLWLVMSSRKG
jgi:hypothetical protein